MANIIDILIKMTKSGHGDEESTTGLQKLGKAFQNLTGLSLNAAGALGLAAKGMQFVRDAIADTVEYAMDIKDFSMALGVTAEEASKLIQIGDDLRVSTETMSSAFRYALDHGITPNIKGLQAVSEEYNNLTTAEEKMAFAIDTFGRGPAQDMMRFLEAGPDALGEMADALEGSALVMSQDGVDAAEEYRLALDSLNDSIEGIKVDVGTKAIRILTNTIEAVQGLRGIEKGIDTGFERLNYLMEQGAITSDEYKDAYNRLNDNFRRGEQITALAEVSEKYLELKDAQEAQIAAMNMAYPEEERFIALHKSLADAAAEVTEEVEDNTASFEEFQVAVNGKVGPAIEEFTSTQRELKAELSEVNSKIAYFRSLGDGMTDDQQTELDSLIGRYDELQTELQETEAEHKKMMANIVFDMMLRRAEMDGVITDTENAMLTSFAVTSGIWDEETANLYDSLTELMNNAGLSAEEASRLVDILYGKITSIEGTYDIEFQISVRGQMPEGAEFNPVTGDYSYAAGGSMLVPPGYPNDSFMIGVSSGEYVNVVPSSEVINNYSLTLNEAGTRGNVAQDFALLKSLAAV